MELFGSNRSPRRESLSVCLSVYFIDSSGKGVGRVLEGKQKRKQAGRQADRKASRQASRQADKEVSKSASASKHTSEFCQEISLPPFAARVKVGRCF